MLVQNCRNRNHLQAEAVSSASPVSPSLLQGTNKSVLIPTTTTTGVNSNITSLTLPTSTALGVDQTAQIIPTPTGGPNNALPSSLYVVQNENFESQRLCSTTATTVISTPASSSDTVNNNSNINDATSPFSNSNNRLRTGVGGGIDLDLSPLNKQLPPPPPPSSSTSPVVQQQRPADVENNSQSNQQHQFQHHIQSQSQEQSIQSPTAVDNPILSEFDLVASLNRYEKDKGKSCNATPLEPPTLNYFSKPHHPPLQQQQQKQQQILLQHQKFQKALISNPSIVPIPPSSSPFASPHISGGASSQLQHFQQNQHQHHHHPFQQQQQQPISSPTASASALVVTCLPKQPALVHSQSITEKMSDAYLSGVKPDKLKNQNTMRQGPTSAPNTPESIRKQHLQLFRGRMDPMSVSLHDKKEKMEFNQMMMRMGDRDTRPLSYHGRSVSLVGGDPRLDPNGSGMVVNKRHLTSSTSNRSRKETTLLNRRSMPTPHLENRYRDKYDISDLDTNLPRIDLEAIENHLRQAREEERKRRSDREEIRRRLALESDDLIEKPMGRKPSLHSRLQSKSVLPTTTGMNLQICFMNETASDSESPNSDTESKNQQPASLPCVKAQSGGLAFGGGANSSSDSTEDFQTKHARLQAEARQALSQAKEMARLQMSQEKDQRLSPITEMLRNSLEKVGVQLQPERRRLTRQLLTEMNVAQLQVIVNDLHSHIEMLNETLVSLLLERDDLHMEQDSMLVDIEDLTRYLAAKDNSPHQSLPVISARSYLGKK